MNAAPRLLLASRLLFVLSGVLVAAGLVCIAGGLLAGEVIAEELLTRILAEIDPDGLASLPPDFLTTATVERAALALGAGLVLLGSAQLATSIGLRRGQRWAYAAAVVGGLFVTFTVGASAVFMVAAIPAQPQAAVFLAAGAVALGLLGVLYAAIAVMTAGGRRELEASIAA
ncbi:MAG TPA: hypothetical protein VJ839_06750 [Candidatus Limnocylindria bacterium]|nr:hypothetical protein [Candidatus Limnocylindria bacterium]